MTALLQGAKKLVEDGVRRVRRRLEGPGWFRLGEDVTFRVAGFATAPSRPLFAARTYYEVRHLRRVFSLLGEHGVPPGRVLEVGCGYGRLSPYIADHFEEHRGIDVNADALALARGAYPHTRFELGNATEIPFAADHFDAVVTWTVLQHVMPHRIDQALAEIRRVARDRSLIVLCEATRTADTPQSPKAHTQDRPVSFYSAAFAPRPLLLETDITEIDQLEGMRTPGRIMVFGPLPAAP